MIQTETTPPVIEETDANQELISKSLRQPLGELKKSLEMGQPTEMITSLLMDLASKI